MSGARFVLTLSCPNRPGIVATVSAALFEGGFNILDAQQFDDVETGNFFMRVAFNATGEDAGAEALNARFAEIADALRHDLDAARERRRTKRVALLVSRFDHCLVDLLYRWRSGELPMEPVCDHRQLSARDLRAHRFRRHPVPPLPITKQTKMEQEAKLWETVRESKADLDRARPLHADPVRRARRQTVRASASTSTTRSCPASRARSPIIRRMSAA